MATKQWASMPRFAAFQRARLLLGKPPDGRAAADGRVVMLQLSGHGWWRSAWPAVGGRCGPKENQ